MTRKINNWLIIEKLIRKQGNLIKFYELARWEFDVLECLGLFYNPNNEAIYPKQTTISEITGVHNTNVNKALRKLEELHFIFSWKEENNRRYYSLTDHFFDEIDLLQVYYDSLKPSELNISNDTQLKKEVIPKKPEIIVPSDEELDEVQFAIRQNFSRTKNNDKFK